MNIFKTPAKNDDLRHVDTGLSAAERRDAINERRRLEAIAALGAKWLAHPANAPTKGVYNRVGVRVA